MVKNKYVLYSFAVFVLVQLISSDNLYCLTHSNAVTSDMPLRSVYMIVLLLDVVIQYLNFSYKEMLCLESVVWCAS